MEVQSPALNFPAGLCCNCGDTNCEMETQDTRVTRYFGIGGTGTTFHLQIPTCAACRRTLRRRPARFFGVLAVIALMAAGGILAMFALAASVTLPPWMIERRFVIGAIVGLIVALVFYRLRRARPPQTSFYQPVRIREAKVHFVDLMHGPGQVMFMKLAFTNPDYFNRFRNENLEAISAGRLAAVRA
jgi:hypothetical protein